MTLRPSGAHRDDTATLRIAPRPRAVPLRGGAAASHLRGPLRGPLGATRVDAPPPGAVALRGGAAASHLRGPLRCLLGVTCVGPSSPTRRDLGHLLSHFGNPRADP